MHPDIASELIAKCPVCLFTTINKDQLKHHVKNKHSNEEVSKGDTITVS